MRTCRLHVSIRAEACEPYSDGSFPKIELCAGHLLKVTDQRRWGGHIICLTESGVEVAVPEQYISHAADGEEAA